ncbi:hypothetical protein F5Y04DRAFT_40344 [Hypomontagnella monticulosa]|nr:hypothetical protein F5Y04DRAFT_40344 [Hypomontagnella monticulosa]
MEDPRDIVRSNWSNAQKIRSDIMAKITSLKKERGTTNITSLFEEVEQTMAEFRLACMNVLAFDFEYAASKNVELSLWQVHTFLNGEYRKVMGRLLAQNQVVVRRKLEKQYRGFLRIAQSFYRVYIQQLSSRFYIPELHQVAHGTDIAPEKIPPPDSTPPPQLRPMILKSCQITLVRLGDLVRYRCQMAEKVSNSSTNFDKALEYYGLANTIDPDDGSAHHQLAVLYQLQNRHLDIVYHFYRSVCTTKPHELGVTNLEREFRGLEGSSTARKGPIKDPSETMVTWFLRLHAYFFQGEPFSQQAELEEEVLHRIEMAMKSGNDEAILRRMTFINIAAYDVAMEKVKAHWTLQGSQSAQFLLRFNIRTVLIILRVLKAALLDESATSQAPEIESGIHAGDDTESPLCFSPLLMRIFPLFRIYISWIYVSRADANAYREFLEPYISEVYRLLSDTLTLLNAVNDQAITTITSKYLLPEDTEALGLKPFSDQRLPLFLHAAIGDVAGEEQSKHRKTRKPRQRAFGRLYNPHTETIWRIRDIVFCGILLAGSSSYPLAMGLKSHEGRTIECWDFTNEVSRLASVDEATMSRMLNKLKLGNVETTPVDLVHNKSDLQTSSEEPSKAVARRQSIIDHDESIKTIDKSIDKGKSVQERPPSSFLDTDLSGDTEMVNMVNKLLDPADDSRPQSSQTQGDTSYGMNTSLANEIFGRLATDCAQPSTVTKTIPSLPWDYFYDPTLSRPTSQGKNQSALGGDYVPRSPHGQLGGFEGSSYLTNLSTRTHQAQLQHDPKEAYRAIVHNSPGPSQGTPTFKSHQSRASRGSKDIPRSAIVDSSLYAQQTLPGSMQSPDLFTSRVGPTPFLDPQRSTSRTSGSPYSPQDTSPHLGQPRSAFSPNYMERSVSQLGATPNLHSPSRIAGLSNSSEQYGGLQGSRNHFQDASSPIGNETGLLPVRNQGQRLESLAPGQSRHPISSWPLEPLRTGSDFSFSHPSSVYVSTQTVAPGPPTTTAINGNRYNPSPSYGRPGSGYNTNYNRMKTLLDPKGDSYERDREAFESALLDDTPKQRPK